MRIIFSVFSILVSFSAVIRAAVPLPPDMSINREAGQGGWLVVMVQVGTIGEFPFMVDTGAPITICDKSFQPGLGRLLGIQRVGSLRGIQHANIYAAPKLYLRTTPLATGPKIYSYGFAYRFKRRTIPTVGILGMDCLSHYCIQLDFQAGKIHFLDPHQLDIAQLGSAFSMTFLKAGNISELIHPCVFLPGLLGGSRTQSLIDTGCHIDGFVPQGTVKGHFFYHLGHFFYPFGQLHCADCEWNGKRYSDIQIIERDHLSILGLRFLARHLVTLDFPDRMLYLKQTSIAPLLLAAETKSSHH